MEVPETGVEVPETGDGQRRGGAPDGGAPGPRRVTERVAALHQAAVPALPDSVELASMPASAQVETLDQLRVELYALAALHADAVVGRAERARDTYPPYGLARSMFAQWGLVKASPDPYEADAITSFLVLWQAFVDTMVLHLHAEFASRRRSPAAWTVERVDSLLALFRVAADAQTLARLRDAETFLYGGLQFGASVCVQLVEVMARLLGRTALPAPARRAVLLRSRTPALRLATFNLEHALATYRGLLSTAPDTPADGRVRPGWLDVTAFALDQREAAAPRIVMTGTEQSATATTYTTLGCPARLAPTTTSPIAVLWGWCVDVADAAGLLARAGSTEA